MKNTLANKFPFALILIFAAVACLSAATNSTINPGDSQADTIKRKIEPAALVADLYKQHDAQKSPFFQTKNRALVDKYFTRATADLIWRYSTTERNEPGALAGDPLYDAQDTEIKNFKVGQAVVKNKSATVTVTFANLGERKKIVFVLVKEKSGWKIEDIKYDGGYTLVELLKEDSSTNHDSNGAEKMSLEIYIDETDLPNSFN